MYVGGLHCRYITNLVGRGGEPCSVVRSARSSSFYSQVRMDVTALTI